MAVDYKLEQLMRWYGPGDPVSLPYISQAGCTGVVSALHAIPVGNLWELDTINYYKSNIEKHDLTWTVVESLPVHDEIKKRKGRYLEYIENYKASILNLSKAGIKVITYNFMPVLDWLRTDVAYRLENGSEALRFDWDEYSMVDLFLLKRNGAEKDYSDSDFERLLNKFNNIPEDKKEYILNNILLGLPGSDVPFTIEEVLAQIASYDGITEDILKENLIHFLKEITPVAESAGIQLAIHPDDPPFPVFGLPRIMKTSQDISDVVQAVPSSSNGLCFCTGSFGARKDNDLIQMIRDWGGRVYFLHLRNTKWDQNGNFFEANHLEGDADMYGIMKEVVLLMKKENRSIPMRPDHGHKMLDDIQKKTYPGYSAIGRLKSLAELRGLEYAVQRSLEERALEQEYS